MNAKTCEGCKFNVLENGTQTGCAINKLERFKTHADAVLNSSNVYEFSRICIYKRNTDWEGNIEQETTLPMSYIFILKVGYLAVGEAIGVGGRGDQRSG